MTKTECLNKATEIRAEAAKLIPACLILNDWTNYEKQIEWARDWERLARLHPQTRNAEIRSWARKSA